MSVNRTLDFDAEDVEVHPWCGLHNVRLDNERAPMSAMKDDEEHVYTMDLSWSECGFNISRINNHLFGQHEYETGDCPVDGWIEEDQNTWYTKVTVLTK